MPPSKAPVLSSPEQVTAADLTAILNQAGFSGTVESVAWQRIGAGQVGQNARFTLTADGDLPKTIVGKFPATDPTSRQTGILLRNYEREVFFYSNLAATVDIRTPTILAVQFDPDTHEFMLLMEDLAPRLPNRPALGGQHRPSRLSVGGTRQTAGPALGRCDPRPA